MTGSEGEARRAARSSRPLEVGTPLEFLRGVGPRRAEGLAALGLVTVGDLLRHYPRRYEDRSRLRRIRDAAVGETQVLYGEIIGVGQRNLRGGRTILEVRVGEVEGDPSDAGGFASVSLVQARSSIDLVFFNQAYLAEWLRPGLRLHAHGLVRLRQAKLQMVSPEFELDAAPAEGMDDPSPHVNRIVPIYPLTKGIHQRFLRGLVHDVLKEAPPLPPSPHEVLHEGGQSLLDALRHLHFPAADQDLALARARVVWDEHFRFATHLHFRRRACRDSTRPGFVVTGELDRKIRSVFPFRFTPDQDQAIEEMVRDLRGPGRMYRLLQGDVGTGKTAVALYAMLAAVRNRFQAVIMAPTEILAEQHYRTVTRCLEGHPVRVELVTGSVSAADRRRAKEALASGAAHLAIGTHALVQDDVAFRQLGLIVIDEQHRFGVRERMRLRAKGCEPHILVMTATPIPRSLCLTAYGDLDLSVLRARPEGRRAVKTYLVKDKERAQALEFVRKCLKAGHQAYFVYPLVDDSETLALPAATKARDRLSEEVFPEYRVGLVHGRLPPTEKQRELDRFRKGETQVLVATVVVEVGIDVPNATVLFIEDSSRFGLAQLHQLRGRVGRGSEQGYCLAGYGRSSREGVERLKAFAATDDGFRIAEEDLRIRGPGDYLGARQSGRPHFLLGNPLEDLAAFARVKVEAERFWSCESNHKYLAQWGLESALEPGSPESEGFLGLD